MNLSGGVRLNSTKRVEAPRKQEERVTAVVRKQPEETSSEMNKRQDVTTNECGAGSACCASSSRFDCAWCGAKEGSIPGIPKHKPCGRCKITSYCSIGCQKRHWKEGGHKQHCVAPADRKASAALAGAQKVEAAKLDTKVDQSARARTRGTAAGGNNDEHATPAKSDRGAESVGRAVFKNRDDDDDDECAMCLESLASAKVLKLPCSHVYHAQCVVKLREFGIQQVCPLCRADLPPGPDQLFNDASYRYIRLQCRYGRGNDKPWRPIAAEDRAFMEEMVSMLEEAADQGHANAQCNLGVMYDKGNIVAQNYPAAMKWHRMAADQGYADAQFNLGAKYEEGHGVAQDYSAAIKWFRMAANQGHVKAQYNLALKYDSGQGVAQDHSVAMKWYRMAADQGDEKAQYNLAFMYEKGKGVAQDDSAAMKWYRMAAVQGRVEAQYNLAFMYEKGKGVAQDYPAAMKWYRMAADQGRVEAQYNVGVMYEKGQGVAQDYPAAMKWYRMAADQGRVEAQYNVGRMHYFGLGTLQNSSEALRWFHKAQMQGHEGAKVAIQLTIQRRRHARLSQTVSP